jgi:hypothetical protein
VINDEICIVAPNSCEIVEVITAPGRTARAETRGMRLSLSSEEQTIVLRSVELDRGSMLGLGALAPPTCACSHSPSVW